jgi:hypothetical protein
MGDKGSIERRSWLNAWEIKLGSQMKRKNRKSARKERS